MTRKKVEEVREKGGGGWTEVKKMKVVQLREGEQGRTEKERSGRVRTDSEEEESGRAKRRGGGRTVVKRKWKS